jgi:hypothetical protein
LVVAWVAFRQWGQATRQREQDLRWRQAEEGRKILDHLFLSDQHGGLDALMMADLPEGVTDEFEDRRYSTAAQKCMRQVRHNQVIEALHMAVQNPAALDDTGAFIVGCFDDLFYYLERIGFFQQSGLVTLDDVGSPLGYYAQIMVDGENWGVYDRYLVQILACRARRFLQLVARWQPQP